MSRRVAAGRQYRSGGNSNTHQMGFLGAFIERKTLDMF